MRDDAAILQCGNELLIITHDAMVEGRHYLASQDMADVAWKLVATNLSDLAAKGAEPIGVILGHCLGDGDERFIQGLHEILSEYKVTLLGGDTVATHGPRVLGCTAIGRATHTPVPSRGHAMGGDALYVTGALGQAMLGFEALRDNTGLDSASYRRPIPLLQQGRALAPLVTAMMDISDGLLLDCLRLAEASEVTIDVNSQTVPVADPARADECMRWGDDYQLLFTAPEAVVLPVAATKIGAVKPRGTAALLIDGGLPERPDTLGYLHG